MVNRAMLGGRGLALLGVVVIGVVLICCVGVSQGSIGVGIDLGTETFKVALIKPGSKSVSFDLVLNSQSGRKTLNLVGFDERDERHFADAARPLVLRSPNRVVAAAQHLLARPPTHPISQLMQKRFGTVLESDNERGVSTIVIGQNITFSPEEIVGMVLETAQVMANAATESIIKDVMITVPPQFTEHERRGLIDAARLAGLNPLLINSGAAVAQQWALNRDLPEEEEIIAFYDMGAGSLTVTIAGFQTVKDSSTKEKPVPQITVKAVAWDDTVGGIEFDRCLAEYIADLVNKKRPGEPDIRNSQRAFSKIKKEARSIKEILSANQAYLVSIESLIGDYDFSSTITRQEFEAACTGEFAKVLGPLQKAIEEAGLTVNEINGVEIVGGGARVPKIQEIVSEYIGKTLDHHLNGDEAAVFGATFQAAILSRGLRVNTEYRLRDTTPYEIGLKVESTNKEALAEGEDSILSDILFRKGKRLSAKRTVTFRMSTNFTVDLFYTESDAPANSPKGIKQIQFTNVPSPSTITNMTGAPKISLSFQLSPSGIVELLKAEAEITVNKWEETLVNATSTNNTASSETSTTETESKTTTEEEKTEEKKADTESKTEPETDSEAENKTKDTKPKVEKIVVGELVSRKRTITLKYTIKPTSIHWLSDEGFKASQAKLRLWNRKDQARRELEEARNSLESYIYSTRERLYDDDFISASTEEERETLSSRLSEHSDWLDEVESATVAEYRAKLNSLKDIGELVQFRLDEKTRRPEAATFLKEFIPIYINILANISKIHNITDEELKDAYDKGQETLKWIEEKEKEQESKSITDQPAFTAHDVSTKGKQLQSIIQRLKSRPRKRVLPPIPPKKDAKKSAETSSDAPNAEPAQAEPEPQTQTETEQPHTETETEKPSNEDSDSHHRTEKPVLDEDVQL